MKSTKKRKFRHWDNVLLQQNYERAAQILAKIEETDLDNLENMPPSLIPTDNLYDMVSCFISMYDKLLEQELLEAGYPKKSSTALH